MGQRLSGGGLDMLILAQGLEGCLPEFQWTELLRLSPRLVMPRGHPLAKSAEIDPTGLREQPLHGLGRADFPEYAERLRDILRPFGVKPLLASQSADGIATLFATLEADGGLAVLNEGILDMLPAALVSRPFSPALAPSVVVLGLPAVQPNVHAETFVRLLHEEAGRGPIPATKAAEALTRSSTAGKVRRRGR